MEKIMPLYDYKCAKCQKEFEKVVPMEEYKDKQECPFCHENEKTGERQIKPVFLKNVG
jgi:putative FmdB family regulatory protein